MKIAVIGTGYVGIVTAVGLAEFGHTVIGADKIAEKIEKISRGEVPIYEPGLEDMLKANLKKGNLTFSSDLNRTIQAADVIFVCVGTPQGDDGSADMSQIEEVSRLIAENLNKYKVVVEKSTVPVKTSSWIKRTISLYKKSDQEFDVASNPEFLREGSAIEDFRRPDRVVVGCDTERAREVMREIYRPLYISETPIVFTSRETSELIKYAANAFLATKITFINEMASLCEKVGGDVQDVARGIGLDGRIGGKFLHAGPGFGGSCFPKDTLALVKTARDAGAPSQIVEAVVAVNDARKIEMAKKIETAFGGVKGKTVAVLGLTFKPNTDDMRDAPSLVIVPYLQGKGARIRAYDPEGAKEAKKRLNLDLCKDSYDALGGADGVVILTEWNEFRALDLERVKSLLKRPLMVDLRNIYRPGLMKDAGFEYFSVGRPSAK